MGEDVVCTLVEVSELAVWSDLRGGLLYRICINNNSASGYHGFLIKIRARN